MNYDTSVKFYDASGTEMQLSYAGKGNLHDVRTCRLVGYDGRVLEILNVHMPCVETFFISMKTKKLRYSNKGGALDVAVRIKRSKIGDMFKVHFIDANVDLDNATLPKLVEYRKHVIEKRSVVESTAEA